MKMLDKEKNLPRNPSSVGKYIDNIDVLRQIRVAKDKVIRDQSRDRRTPLQFGKVLVLD
jgi:hypothetical protein